MESGAGNDWLKGGAGEDTYVFGKTDTGVDTIYDSDGKGHLEYEGQKLKGGMRLHQNVWFNKDQSFIYSLIGSEANPILLVQRKEGEQTRTVARIRNWRNGDLGLSMSNQSDTDGASMDLNQSGTAGYIHINAGQADKGVSLAGNGQSNSFIGSNHDDHISTGDGNGNYVMAGSGSDVVIGGEGREYIRAGQAFTRPGMADDDTVYGGPNTDMIYGSAGDDWLHPRMGLASRAARNGLPLHPGRGHQLHAAAARS